MKNMMITFHEPENGKVTHINMSLVRFVVVDLNKKGFTFYFTELHSIVVNTADNFTKVAKQIAEWQI